ncbi:SDR family oxidoreductase [Saccharopolyspora hirsuta]|uniref:SDR family oxidoreductase n=1 Tax=Saccharopolyspora hirsuta TaxID=1837 RepID=A0A5M7BY49_SACHI|nr:SDR family oxidoreductase [Saccharopolyspora hirsuta]KAA5834413.1 SDR family oxidoreductase [Saccharopolyspora hirsuta]
MAEAFDGKVVLITGGGTGIGAATAARLAGEGARVVVTGRRRAPLDEVAAATGALAVPGDSSVDADARAVVDRTLAEFGRLDVLVVNAGGHGMSAVADTTDEDWRRSLDGNLNSAFVMCRAALPALVEARGNIVVMSSVAGLFAGPEVAGYTVGKHALIGLTRSMARDYGPRGVRVNAICPGWVRTPMSDQEMADFAAAADLPDRESGYAAVTADLPLRRAAEPGEIAAVCRFLASDEASFITGAVLVADGGGHAVDLPTVPIGRAM